ncbi:hypothetical protein ABZ379_31485 [Streptomyces canus]|uniref:hypothetical protein n=1 Tax=Streptomyces canus TaxID=58343 RepID=UPI00340DABC9
MRARLRTMGALAVAVLTVGGLTTATATTAAAAPGTALACYDHRHSIDGTDPNGHWPPYSSTYTTSYCNDINVKMTTTVSVQTCFDPTNGDPYCNGWRTVYANTWGLAATDVRDGTNFWLLFSSTGVQGVAAY